MTTPWPGGAPRVPDEDWTRQPLGELALKYDTVERHGWYRNLEPTVDELERILQPGQVLVDYSGGTGILAERLLERLAARPARVLLVDSSAKFLRLALEKLGGDERVGFRLIRWLKEEKRLQRLDEVLEPELVAGGVDALVSTNAIHLYDHVEETLGSWAAILRPGARLHVQSGNIGSPRAPGEWIIDDTVESIHRAATAIVRREPNLAPYRAVLEDDRRMAAHDAIRRRYFLPVRPQSLYLEALTGAGFELIDVTVRRIEARVAEWRDFLAVYHEGVLGWIGGVERVEGKPADEAAVQVRLDILGRALADVFGGREVFTCCWTYVNARRP